MIFSFFIFQPAFHDQPVKYHKHGRQGENNGYHADQRAPGHKGTQGADHINVGIQANSEGCREEG